MFITEMPVSLRMWKKVLIGVECILFNIHAFAMFVTWKIKETSPPGANHWSYVMSNYDFYQIHGNLTKSAQN